MSVAAWIWSNFCLEVVCEVLLLKHLDALLRFFCISSRLLSASHPQAQSSAKPLQVWDPPQLPPPAMFIVLVRDYKHYVSISKGWQRIFPFTGEEVWVWWMNKFDSKWNPLQLWCTQKLKVAHLLRPYLKKVNILCSWAAKCDLYIKFLRTLYQPSGLVGLQEVTV